MTKRQGETRPPLICRRRRDARRRRMFTKLPETWSERLAGARYVATWAVAERCVVPQSFRDHQPTVRLANSALAARGVTRKQKARALTDLEELELVRVDRHERKSPTVTLLLDPCDLVVDGVDR